MEHYWGDLGVEVYSRPKNKAKNRVARKGVNVNVPIISWPNYLSRKFPYGIKNLNDTQRKNQDWRRWQLADKDANNKLTKHEFKVIFHLLPHINERANNHAKQLHSI